MLFDFLSHIFGNGVLCFKLEVNIEVNGCRYGSLHGNVLGVEFVKADGTVVDVLSKNKKDNTGIDLKQLMIGSEGILGIVTKAAVQCPPLSKSKHLLFAGVDSYADCVEFFGAARREIGEILSAYWLLLRKRIKILIFNYLQVWWLVSSY